MSKEVDWIKVVVEETRNTHESVTDAAVLRIEELLERQLTQRQIPTAELRSLATTLISDMVPQQPKIEDKDED